MTHDTGQPDGYQVQRRQHQKQRQQRHSSSKSIPTSLRAAGCRRSNISPSTIRFLRRHSSIPTVAINNFTSDWFSFLRLVLGARRLRRRRALVLRTEPRAASRPFGFDRMAQKAHDIVGRYARLPAPPTW